MRKYKEIEKVLWDYKSTKCEIKNIELEIQELSNDTAEKDEIKKLKTIKLHKENLIQKIDNAIEILPEAQKRIIELRYFTGLQFKQIAARLNLNEIYCIQLKTKILKEIYPIIFIGE